MFRALADNDGVLRFAVLALLVLGCGRARDGASCGEAAGVFFKLATDDVARTDAAIARQVRDQLPAMRDALDTACKDGKWDRGVRDCIAQATDPNTITTCEQALTQIQRSSLDVSARGQEPKR